MKNVFKIMVTLMVLLGAYNVYAIEQFSRVKVWGREVLTKDDLNAEFDAIVNALNTRLLNGGTTFTIVQGDSLLVLGRGVMDTLRVRTVFLLEGNIVPDADGAYNIGTSGARVDTFWVQDIDAYKVTGDTLNATDTLIVGDGSRAWLSRALIDSLIAPDNNTIGGTSTLTGNFGITQSGGTSTLNADSTYFAFPDTILAKASYKILPFDMTDGRFLEIDGMTGESAYQRFLQKVKGTSWYKDEGRFPRRGAWQITAGQDSVILWDYTVSPVDTVMVFFDTGTTNLFNGNVQDIKWLDGCLYLGVSGAFYPIDFIRDNAFAINSTAKYLYAGNLAERNSGKGYSLVQALTIVSNTVNAVSVIRDPEGATDSFGRRLPIVALGTASNLSISNAGITAFYDSGLGGPPSFSTSRMTNEALWFLDTQTNGVFRRFNPVQTLIADGFTATDSWATGGTKATRLPATWVTYSVTAMDVLPSVGVFGNDVMLGGTNKGMIISHTKHNDHNNGITIDLSTTHNIARSDTLAWDLGSVNGVFNNPLTLAVAGVTYGDGKIGWGATSNGTGYLTRYTDTGLRNLKSLSLWFKSTSATNPASVESIIDLREWVSPTDRNNMSLFAETSGAINFYVNDAGSNITSGLASDVYDAKWHHLVLTQDGANQRMYVDAVLVDTDAQTSVVAPDSMVVFAQIDGTTPFNGSVDNLALWSRALTQDEISFLYNRGVVANGNLSDYLGANDVDYASADPNANTFTFGNQDTTYHTTPSGLPLARIPSAGGNITDAHVIASGDSSAIYQATSTKTKVYQPDLTVQQLAQDKGVEFARPIANIKRFVSPSNLHLFDAVVDSAGYGDYTQVDQAIDAGAKSIFIKNGTYSPFDADVAGLHIVGESWDVIIDGGTTDDAIDLSAANITVENLTVKTTSGTGNAYDGIDVTASNARIVRVQCTDSDDTGININTGGVEIFISDCLFLSSDGNAVYVDGPRSRVIGNHIVGTVLLAPSGDNFVFSMNHIEGTGTLTIHANAEDGSFVGNVTDGAITDNSGTSTGAGNEQY